jgi:hypothetical protein
MAIGTPSLLTANSVNSAGQTSFTTASVSPASGSVQFVAAYFRSKSGTNTPTIAGNGRTWSLVRIQTGTNTQEQIALWVGIGTPSTGTITVTRDASETWSQVIWSVFEVAGTDATTPVVAANTVFASAVQSATTQTINYAQAFASGGAGVAVFGSHNSPTATPRTDWTELQETIIGGNCTLQTQYRLTADTAAGVTWSAAGRQIGIAVELKEESPAPPPASGHIRLLFRAP